MDLIRCPRCAKEIPDASYFCRRCGCAIAWRAGAMPPAVHSAHLDPSGGRRRCSDREAEERDFSLLAIGGGVFFLKYHATVRPVAAPSVGTVRYQPPQLPPPVSFPKPLRSNSAVTNNARALPTASRKGPAILIEPATPPAPPRPWDAEYTPRYEYQERTRSTESSSSSDRSAKRP